MKKYLYSIIIILILIITGCASAFHDTRAPVAIAKSGSKNSRNDEFSFIILGDRTGISQKDIYSKIIEKSLKEKADFYITVGDHIEGYTDTITTINKQWDEYFLLIKEIPVDIYFVPGNHDIWNAVSSFYWSEKTETELNYSFMYKGVHFIILDVSRWEKASALPDSYILWLLNVLSLEKNARLRFVFFHKPFWDNTLQKGKKDLLHEIFKEYGVDAVFNGHLHYYKYAEFDGIKYFIIGSSGGYMYKSSFESGFFYHFGLVEVTSDGFNLTIIPLEKEIRFPYNFMSIR